MSDLEKIEKQQYSLLVEESISIPSNQDTRQAIYVSKFTSKKILSLYASGTMQEMKEEIKKLYAKGRKFVLVSPTLLEIDVSITTKKRLEGGLDI